MSGWLLGGELIQNQGALMDAPLGRGDVVMFGFSPQYRGQSYVDVQDALQRALLFRVAMTIRQLRSAHS